MNDDNVFEDVEQLFYEALEQIEKIESGKKFYVRDLFRGYQWNQTDMGARLMLGKLFSNEKRNKYLKSGVIVPIEQDKEGKKKQQQYLKV